MAGRPGSVLRVKLLLDEHFSPDIARQLRQRGHDVVVVTERPGLPGRPDRVHFASSPDEQRAIVTRDLADFRPLLAESLRLGSANYGLVCVPRRFPLSRQGIDRLVSALDALLQDHPQADGAIAAGGELWLQERSAP